MTHLSDSIRSERRRKGLTQKELAKAAGVAPNTITKIEVGTGNPSVRTLHRIAAALDTTLDRLLRPVP